MPAAHRAEAAVGGRRAPPSAWKLRSVGQWRQLRRPRRDHQPQPQHTSHADHDSDSPPRSVRDLTLLEHPREIVRYSYQQAGDDLNGMRHAGRRTRIVLALPEIRLGFSRRRASRTGGGVRHEYNRVQLRTSDAASRTDNRVMPAPRPGARAAAPLSVPPGSPRAQRFHQPRSACRAASGTIFTGGDFGIFPSALEHPHGLEPAKGAMGVPYAVSSRRSESSASCLANSYPWNSFTPRRRRAEALAQSPLRVARARLISVACGDYKQISAV